MQLLPEEKNFSIARIAREQGKKMQKDSISLNCWSLLLKKSIFLQPEALY